LKRRKEPDVPCDQNLIGYARVSTEEQNLGLQRDALLRAGVCEFNIFEEKVSGAAQYRPVREQAFKQCRPGSTFVVWRLDRVGRDLLDLLTFMKLLDAEGIGFKSLQDQIDTTTPVGRVMLAMLGAFAQFERDLIQQRTKAGVERAMAAGKRFGQPSKMTDETRAKLEAVLASGGSVVQAAKAAKIAPSTLRLHYKAEDLKRIRARKK